jgi:hypothetical protein
MAAKKFNVGDKAVIVKNVNSHKFKIGQVVTITEKSGADYTAKSIGKNPGYWWVVDKELRKHNPKTKK